MAKQYKKAPAYMGKYLSIKVGARDKTVQDNDILTGNLDMYVELGMLVEVPQGDAPAPAPARAPAPRPAPAPAPAREPPSGITKSPAAKIAKGQQEAFSKPKSAPKKTEDKPPEKKAEPKKKAPAKKAEDKPKQRKTPAKKAPKKAPAKKKTTKKRGRK